MNSLRLPSTDEQPSSAPVSSHTRQRSRSLTRELAALNLPPASSPSSPAPLSPTSPSPLSPSPLSPSASLSPRSTLKSLTRHVEYYFSNANLWKDLFLLHEMSKNPNAYVPLPIVAAFKKVARLAPDTPTLIAAIRQSTKLQLNADDTALRRIQPLPPYDQLKDAPRSLYVEHLPPSSTLKSVKKLFSLFGKVTYVLRADQIGAASQLNASPRQSPLVAPASPGVGVGGMPRLSLSAASSPGGSAGVSLAVPMGTASDAVDGVFTSAFVQFEKAETMEQAVEMIHAQQAAHRLTKGSNGSPAMMRRSLELRPSGSPALSSRALGLSVGERNSASPSPIPHINEVIILSPQTKPRGSAHSSPPLVALPPSALGSGSADTPIPILDLSGSSAGSRPATPNTPQSPSFPPLDPSTPLPAVFLTVVVQTKGEYLQALEDKADRMSEAEKEREKQRQKDRKKGNNWRRTSDTTAILSTAHPLRLSNGDAEDAKEAEPDPLLVRMKEDALRRGRLEELEKEREREKDKEYRRQHLSERLQERAAASAHHKAVEKVQELSDIIHISPKPSPVLRPTPSPILTASPQLAAFAPQSAGHSPVLQSSALSLSPSFPPHLELGLAKPRFSLTKRTSVVAASVASHFALGPDAPDSKGFNGRGRGRIIPLSFSTSNSPHTGPSHPPLAPPPLH